MRFSPRPVARVMAKVPAPIKVLSPVLLASFLVAGCSVFGAGSGIEEPDFQVVERLGEDAAVRRYSERVAVETVVGEGDTGRTRGQAFRRLARYIGGANRAETDIAMTAPVETAQAERPGTRIEMTAPVETAPAEAGGLRMRFFLPAQYTPETAPRPTESQVSLVTLPEQTMAVLRFSGGRGAGRVAARAADLRARLEGTGWQPAGPPVAYFYDPPWTLPFLRRNEVVIPVERG